MPILKQWRYLMETRKLFTLKLTASTWLPISSNSCLSMTSSMMHICLRKRFSTKFLDSSSISCASITSTHIQERSKNVEWFSSNCQCALQLKGSANSQPTLSTSERDLCSRSLEWALTFSRFKTSSIRRDFGSKSPQLFWSWWMHPCLLTCSNKEVWLPSKWCQEWIWRHKDSRWEWEAKCLNSNRWCTTSRPCTNNKSTITTNNDQFYQSKIQKM